MDIQNFLTTIQHINWLRVIKNYHARHYIWEISKVLIPALLTGLITFVAMRIIDNKNKKRWLNDGHMKRKTDLEIEIRKFLLGIKSHTSEYEILADLYNPKSNTELEYIDSKIIYNFNKDFENLFKYFKNEESQTSSNVYDDKSIFALMDEYICYVPKMKHLFNDFKALCDEICELKTLDDSNNSEITSEEVKAIALKHPGHFEKMVNAYLCFQLVIERILKKLTGKI